MKKFELDEDQERRIREWQQSIKKIFGEYGQYEYRFRPTGIGTQVVVYSDLAKKEFELTDVDKW